MSAFAQPNPFSPASGQASVFTPNLGDVITYAMQRTGLDLRVCMPAKITKVRGPQLVDVQPLFTQMIATQAVEYPVITSVPVSMPVGQDYALTLPLQVQDTGLVLFSDRALDAYVASSNNKPVAPTSDRTHHLTDAIFVPGLVPIAKQTTPTTDLVLRNGIAEIRLSKAGTFKIDNGQNDVIGVLADLVQALVSAQVITSTGPASFSPAVVAKLSSLAAQLSGLRGL